MTTVGIHLFCELGGCNLAALNDVAVVKQAIYDAAAAAKVTVLNGYFHRFAPSGVSGIVAIAESHISVHTWPEAGYAAVDIFTCGDHAMPQTAAQVLADALRAKSVKIMELKRGVPLGPDSFGVEIRTRDASPVAACEATAS
jgi:S-adenosylmethionine decarboxylase